MVLQAKPVFPRERIAVLDVLRGFALLGILTMNITAGLPGGARLNPLAAGGMSANDFAVWLAGYVLFDEKMITLFSMLFGAGLFLVSEGRSARFFYRRTAILLFIGLAHAYLLWEGDILVTYALCGMVIYPLRQKTPGMLLVIAALLWSVVVPLQVGFAAFVERSRVASGAEAELWSEMRKTFQPTPAEIAREIDERRAEQYPQSVMRRAPEALAVETTLFLVSMLWTVSARMLLGMALFKLDILSGAKPTAFYIRMMAICYAVGFPLVGLAAWLQIEHNFDVVYLFGRTFLLNAFASLFVASGHAALLIWIYRRGWAPRALAHLAAVGRMALSNYLMQSVLMTFLFYSYGLGLFGALTKVQLFGVVLAIWALQIFYSRLWLRHFQFGPVEWAWRSLAYGHPQPLIQVCQEP